jgi:FtsP/CotA-like multicopper oxidase with cupredoxin domain
MAMSAHTKNAISMTRLLPLAAFAATLMLSGGAQAAAPGITGDPTASTTSSRFNLSATPAYITQPDGQAVYSWGYGCTTGSTPAFAPAATLFPAAPACSTMQIPGPTLIVTEGESVTVTLTNNLPASAGNTSILFPGFNVATSCSASTPAGVQGLLTCEAAPSGTVTYTFTAGSPGTRAYYSGTQGDLQVEMGLYGAIIVLPNGGPTNGTCPTHNSAAGIDPATPTQLLAGGESNFRLSPTGAAYHLTQSCYDREYLFQFSEMDPNIHNQALAQVTAKAGCTAGAAGCSLEVPTEPYHPVYFMINGRSMPDDMDTHYAAQYPHQPYNGNPHMHPGELVLLRIIGQGRWQHPFHEHGNHVRILARDGNLITAGTTGAAAAQLAGPLLFTTTTTPGLAMDGIFYWTGKGLNWDAYGHHSGTSTDPLAVLTCTPDANGYNTGTLTAVNYYEWCQDHDKPLQSLPFGEVASGGPATLPDPNLFTNGPWYGGSPYLGPDATVRATGPTGTTPPSGTIANPPTSEAGFAFMWHSHNEREITTNNIFPGGMLMMMLVDSREFVIDESN